MVCINKYDINEENSRQIESYCLSEGVRVVAKIPFDNVVTEAMVHGLPLVEYAHNGVSHQIEALWGVVLKSLNK
jgi:MinD superfamily P-loop ATPase